MIIHRHFIYFPAPRSIVWSQTQRVSEYSSLKKPRIFLLHQPNVLTRHKWYHTTLKIVSSRNILPHKNHLIQLHKHLISSHKLLLQKYVINITPFTVYNDVLKKWTQQPRHTIKLENGYGSFQFIVNTINNQTKPIFN